jgi:cyclase
MSAEITVSNSKHFTIQTLAEGVFALINKRGGSAICNAGIIDLGGLCLVFDTFQSPRAAEDLLQAVKDLVGYGPDLVINSHYHNDHIWGNQVFEPPVHIVASSQTYQLMLTAGKKVLEEEYENAAHELAVLKEEYEKTEDELQRRDAELFISVYEGLMEDLPRLVVRLPDITYTDRMIFYGTKRSAELISYDRSHSGNDAVLFLHEEGIIYMGDLLFAGCHPYLGECDPENLVKTLRKIQNLKATRFVPGHGPVGSMAELLTNIDYVDDCIKTAHALVKADRADEETINGMQAPERFRNLLWPHLYPTNLQALCLCMTAT